MPELNFTEKIGGSCTVKKRLFLIPVLIAVMILNIAKVAEVSAENFGEKYKLNQIVILSRHNIRTPFVEGSKVPAGFLTNLGGVLEVENGQYFREYLKNEGLLPEIYSPAPGEIRFYANSYQRTIATAKYFSSGMFPNTNIETEYKYKINEKDPVFLEHLPNNVNEKFYKAIDEKFEKIGGIQPTVDYVNSRLPALLKAMKLKKMTDANIPKKYSAKDVEPSKKWVKTEKFQPAIIAADTLIMNHYADLVAGVKDKLTEEDWQKISDISYLGQYSYSDFPEYSLFRSRNMLKLINDELETEGRKFTFLCGHDTNLSTVLSALGVEDYTAPKSLITKTPIGGKIVIEKRIDDFGREFIDVNLVYQSTRQIQNLEFLSADNPPMILPLNFKGIKRNEDGLYTAKDFKKLLTDKIAEYDTFVD